MSTKHYIPPEWYVICQALGDGMGYPKGEEKRKWIGYSYEELNRLHDEILNNHDKALTNKEKQIILNSLDGALDYVDTDIPALYDGLSQQELRNFKESLEKRWNMNSTYHQISNT